MRTLRLLSPIGPTGIIVNGIMDKMGMPAVPWQTYLIVMAAHTIVAFTGYVVFGGWKFFRPANVKREVDIDQLAMAPNRQHFRTATSVMPERPFQWRHWLTLDGDRRADRRRGRLRRPRGDGGVRGGALLSLLGRRTSRRRSAGCPGT